MSIEREFRMNAGYIVNKYLELFSNYCRERMDLVVVFKRMFIVKEMKGKYVLLEDFVEFLRMIDILLVDIFFEENKMKCHKLYK